VKFADIADHLWTTAHAPLSPRPSQPSQRPLRQAHPLLLRDDGEDADDSIAEHAAGVEVLFCVAPEANTVAGQGLEMLQGLEDALTAEAVERPE